MNNYAADLMEHSREEMINRDFDHHMMEIFSLSLVQAFLSAIESALKMCIRDRCKRAVPQC